MNNDLLERAGRLHHEAGELMQEIRLQETLQSYGGIIMTGSYFLDLMVYPDLDLYMPMVSIPRIFEAAGQIANTTKIIRVTYENEDHPTIQGGLYLNFRVNLGEWGRPWKVDIWWLEAGMIEQKMEIMHHFKHRLTPELREHILHYKYSILNSDRRTPMYSGYYVYKAFLDEGLQDPAEITRYLAANGVKLT